MGKERTLRLLYYISFLAVIFSDFILRVNLRNFGFYTYLYRGPIILACVLLVLKYILDKHTIKELISTLIVGFVGLLIAYSSKEYYKVLPLTLLLISIRGINLKYIFKLWVMELFILMSAVAVGYNLNILQEGIRANVRSNGFLRKTLGYDYSTYSANYFFHLVVFYCYLRKNRFKLLELISILLINFYLYRETDTKSAFAFTIITVVLFYLSKFLPELKEFKLVNRFIVPFSMGVVLVLNYIYESGSALGQYLDRFLTNRLYLSSMGFRRFGITLFGQEIKWVTENKWYSEVRYNYIDSSYLNILFNYGLILLIFILIGYYLLSNKTMSKNIYYTILVSMIALHSMFDPQLLEISANPAILFLGYLLTREDIIDNHITINYA